MPPWLWPRAAYIHVPFCAHHCGYCDFAVVTGRDHLTSLYLEALEAEMATLQEPQPVSTIFIGGGTPTYLGVRQLERLLDFVTRWLQKGDSALEFTVEANPGSLSTDGHAIVVRNILWRSPLADSRCCLTSTWISTVVKTRNAVK